MKLNTLMANLLLPICICMYVCLYGTSVTCAPPLTKPIGCMKYLATISPRQKKSIVDHVDVCDRDQTARRLIFE